MAERNEDLFAEILYLPNSWRVERLEHHREEKRLDLYLEPKKEALVCPECQKLGSVHDRRPERVWRHLDCMEDRTYLHARLPRIECPEHGVKTVNIPWADSKTQFTHQFEALVVAMIKGMPVNAVAKLLREYDTRLWRIVHRHVYRARQAKDMSDVSSIGMDETAARRGHDYVTIFMNTKTREVLYVTPGRSQETVVDFTNELKFHGGDSASITSATMDMSPAFIAGVEKHLPNAQIVFDRFHATKLINDALDEVRRQEQWDHQELLSKTRYLWLKNRDSLSDRQQDRLTVLLHKPIKTARAYLIRESFQALWKQSAEEAEAYLRRWYYWATHSRLTPIIKAARTIHRHWNGILQSVASRLTTGPLEGLNSLVQAAKAKARGYRSKLNFIAMIYLLGGGLDIPLPHTS